jgi:Flp pilus assembly protein TadD
MRFSTVLLLALWFALVGGEAEADWTRLRSTNFTFVGDASERQIRSVAQQLEQFREVMVRALPPAAVAPPAPIVVIVFANDRSFDPFKPRFQERTVEVAGFFRGGPDVNFIAINGDLGANAVRAVFHEYSHFLMSNTVRVAPVWVSEGLAGVYETFQERDGGKRAVLGTAPPEYVQELKSRTLIPISQLTLVDTSSPLYNEGNRRGLLYAQSWALMHYLTFGSEGRRAQLLRYLTHLRSGVSPHEAFSKEFGTDLAALDRELREYVSQLAFPAVLFTFDSTTRAAIEARPEAVSDGEAWGYLGDLLARGGRPEEARVQLKKALAANADAARALYALGLLELRESGTDEALPLLERAATLSPEEAMFLTAYGRALAERLRTLGSDDPQRESTLARARSALSRSVDVKPTAADALATLGYLELTEGEPVRAVDLLKRAVASAPSNESYRMMLADASARQGDYEGATALLSFLLAYGSRQDVRDAARQNLGRVAKLRIAALARIEAADGRPAGTPLESVAKPPPERRSAGGQFTPALRKMGPGEQRVLGVFRTIQCRQGAVVLEIQTATALMRFVAAQLGDIDFISYRTDTPGGVNCGAVPGTPPVLATYRPSAGGTDGIGGAAVAIELIPDGYVPP